VSSVDINMGCPVRKICRNGSGSKLMGDHEKAARFVSLMVGAVKIPVTCKMRLGWDDENLTAPGLACALEDAVWPRLRCMVARGSRDSAGQ